MLFKGFHTYIFFKNDSQGHYFQVSLFHTEENINSNVVLDLVLPSPHACGTEDVWIGRIYLYREHAFFPNSNKIKYACKRSQSLLRHHFVGN